MNENLTKSWQSVSVGGVLFAVCCVVSTCVSMFFSVFLPMSYSAPGEGGIMDLIKLSNYIYLALDIGILVGCVLLISGLNGVRTWLSDGVAAGMKVVCAGMLLFVVVSLVRSMLWIVIEANEDNSFIINVLDIFFLLAICAGLVVMGVGFGQARGDERLSVRSREQFRNVMVLMVVLAVFQLIRSVFMAPYLLIGSDPSDAARPSMVLMVVEILLFKPVRVVGYIVLAVAWAKLVRTLRGEVEGRGGAYGN